MHYWWVFKITALQKKKNSGLGYTECIRLGYAQFPQKAPLPSHTSGRTRTAATLHTWQPISTSLAELRSCISSAWFSSTILITMGPAKGEWAEGDCSRFALTEGTIIRHFYH